MPSPIGKYKEHLRKIKNGIGILEYVADGYKRKYREKIKKALNLVELEKKRRAILYRWVYTTNHKRIGIMYMIVGVFTGFYLY